MNVKKCSAVAKQKPNMNHYNNSFKWKEQKTLKITQTTPFTSIVVKIKTLQILQFEPGSLLTKHHLK